MTQVPKSVVVGLLSGVVTCAISIYALGYTSAFVMPSRFPALLWDALIVFGVGAAAVAFVIHLLVVRVFTARVLPALVAFTVAIVVTAVATGPPSLTYRAIAAWMIGALIASVALRALWSNNSLESRCSGSAAQLGR